MDHENKTDRFLNRNRETMAWEDRKEELNRRFLKTIRNAFDHAGAYREIFNASGLEPHHVAGLEDLEKIPILRMSDLVERQKRDIPFGGFETIEPGQIRRIYVNPGLIWQPGEREYKDTSWAEALCGAGFKRGDRIINAFNYHLWPLAFMLDEAVNRIGATVIPSGVGNTLMQVKIMEQLQITGFMGTPSFIMTLIQRAEAMGLDLKRDIHLDTAVVGAEMLPESLRSRIQDRLEMTVRQIYGTVFVGCIGYECPYMTGLHVPENVVVEVVDPQTGKQVAPGTAGEVVATNFNAAYPMIRMATGDLALMDVGPCPCGRTGPRLKKILGRIDQATKVKGAFIHPWQVDEVISRYPEIFKYQVVISRKDHQDQMTFVVELKEPSSRAEMLRGRIERDIKEFLTLRGSVQMVPRGTIPDHHKKIEDQRSWE